MSWPSDGKPRYKVTSMDGGMIGRDGSAWGKPTHAPVDFYVLDRANCHRVVRRISVAPTYGTPAKGRAEIERICAEMNGESLPL